MASCHFARLSFRCLDNFSSLFLLYQLVDSVAVLTELALSFDLHSKPF